MLNLFQKKITASTSQANIQFAISESQAYSEEQEILGGACTYDWRCTDWHPVICPENREQARICENRGTCSDTNGKPEETRPCLFEPLEPEKPLLNINVEIPELNQEIFPGELIIAQIEIINFGETGRIDVVLEYIITDPENKAIYSRVETVAVETKLNLIKEINLPENIDAGTYLLHVNARYGGKVASSIAEFHVIKILLKEKIFIVIILILIIVLAILIYIVIRQRKKYVLIKKADLKKLIYKE